MTRKHIVVSKETHEILADYSEKTKTDISRIAEDCLTTAPKFFEITQEVKIWRQQKQH